MVTPQRQHATVKDLYRTPEDGLKHELVHGRLVAEPPPGLRHGRVAANLVGRLQPWVESRQLGVVVTCDTGFILQRNPDTVRAPDVAFITRARYGALNDDTGAMPGAPDLAIEVKSPGNTTAEMHAKAADYLAAGTGLVWIVDPQARSVIVYRDLLQPRIVSEPEHLEAPGLLPGFRVALADIFV